MSVECDVENLKIYFDKAGLKATKKRLAILKGIMLSDKAVSPYELAKFCEEQLDLTIPVVSIYRILDLLVAANVVHKLELVNKYIVCAHLDCQSNHPHSQFLICTVCQKVTEIHMPQALTNQVIDHINSSGFMLQSPQFEFQGICKSCLS